MAKPRQFLVTVHDRNDPELSDGDVAQEIFDALGWGEYGEGFDGVTVVPVDLTAECERAYQAGLRDA